MLFPEPRRQFGNTSGGVLADALKQIDEIGKGVDAVQAAGDDQALHDADVLGAEFGPAEKS